MNPLELAIYNTLKRKPRLKLAVRNVYQRMLDWIPQKKLVSSYPITGRPGFFFGFHDHSPFSPDNNCLAAGRFDLSQPIHMPEPNEELEIGIFMGKQFGQWNPITSTKAWNWHQGCKLQWLGSENKLIFNDHVDGRNIARVVSVDNSTQDAILPSAVGSVSPSGSCAVGYSFDRVEKYMPGYGYRYETNRQDLSAEAPESDGIYLIDLQRQSFDLIINLKQLKNIKPESSMDKAYHYVSHTIFSPSSKRFAFLHRWIRGDVTKRWSRIVTADLRGENIRIFPTKDMASHMGWRNENELLAYCRLRNNKDCYVLFLDKNPVTYSVLGSRSFNSDGHPAWSADQRYFLTDTYPDRFRMQYLILYDIVKHLRYNLARLKTYRKFATINPYCHWSCDLHPRWDHTGRFICFDATYSGQRALCTIDLGIPVSELSNIASI